MLAREDTTAFAAAAHVSASFCAVTAKMPPPLTVAPLSAVSAVLATSATTTPAPMPAPFVLIAALTLPATFTVEASF